MTSKNTWKSLGRWVFRIRPSDRPDLAEDDLLHVGVHPRDWRLGFAAFWYDGPWVTLHVGPVAYAMPSCSPTVDYVWDKLEGPLGWHTTWNDPVKPWTRVLRWVLNTDIGE